MTFTDNWHLFKTYFYNLITASINLIAPTIYSIISFLNPIQTFCIVDLRLRNGSRVIEYISAFLLLLNFILIFKASLKLPRLVLDLVILALQLFLLIYISFLFTLTFDPFIYSFAALIIAGVTILSIVMNIIIYFKQNKKDSKITNISG